VNTDLLVCSWIWTW